MLYLRGKYILDLLYYMTYYMTYYILDLRVTAELMLLLNWTMCTVIITVIITCPSTMWLIMFLLYLPFLLYLHTVVTLIICYYIICCCNKLCVHDAHELCMCIYLSFPYMPLGGICHSEGVIKSYLVEDAAYCR